MELGRSSNILYIRVRSLRFIKINACYDLLEVRLSKQLRTEQAPHRTHITVANDIVEAELNVNLLHSLFSVQP